ncbi:hypothetical protein SeMB42_g00029 [Synchytrium endobioticum]|nr:hypothetical protein SeMB42_g00029 [Synchytrium endobioticum]
MACRNRPLSEQVVQLLIHSGADVNARNTRSGRTPLHYVLRNVNSSTAHVTRLLLASGADANLPDLDNVTPLHIAARSGDGCLVTMLFDANTDVTDARGFQAIDTTSSTRVEHISQSWQHSAHVLDQTTMSRIWKTECDGSAHDSLTDMTLGALNTRSNSMSSFDFSTRTLFDNNGLGLSMVESYMDQQPSNGGARNGNLDALTDLAIDLQGALEEAYQRSEALEAYIYTLNQKLDRFRDELASSEEVNTTRILESEYDLIESLTKHACHQHRSLITHLASVIDTLSTRTQKLAVDRNIPSNQLASCKQAEQGPRQHIESNTSQLGEQPPPTCINHPMSDNRCNPFRLGLSSTPAEATHFAASTTDRHKRSSPSPPRLGRGCIMSSAYAVSASPLSTTVIGENTGWNTSEAHRISPRPGISPPPLSSSAPVCEPDASIIKPPQAKRQGKTVDKTLPPSLLAHMDASLAAADRVSKALRSHSQDRCPAISICPSLDSAAACPLSATVVSDQERKAQRRHRFAYRRVGVSLDDLIKDLESMDRGQNTSGV